MATIRIDRGFTHTIQSKGGVHSSGSEPPPPPKEPKRGPKRLVLAAVGGAVLLAVIIAVAAALMSKSEKAKPADAPAAIAAGGVQQGVVIETTKIAVKEPDEAVAPAEQPAQPKPADAPALPVPVKPPSRPVHREITPGSPSGVLCEYFEHVSKPIKALRGDAVFASPPSRTVQFERFELSENIGDTYCARARAFLIPPKTGAYTFAVCADDIGELWLGTDESPATARKIVSLTTHLRNWGMRSEQQSAACELVAGKRYYIEALMKEGMGSDYLVVGWSGPVSDKTTVIDGKYLQPWSDTSGPAEGKSLGQSILERRAARAAREAALEPVRKAIAEQRRANGSVYRFDEAAQALKSQKGSWGDPEALALAETAVAQFELMGKLKAFVREDLSRARLKNVWVAFGGQAADVTGASGEGVTVAPGRIVAWEKIPQDQMLRLVNATLTRATVDPSTKSTCLLAAAVFAKEVCGNVDLAFKYRESAATLNTQAAVLADRLLGGTPESIRALPRVLAARAELDRLLADVPGYADKIAARQTGLAGAAARASASAAAAKMAVEYWDHVTVGSFEELRSLGITTKRPPDYVGHVSDLSFPENRGDHYVARVKGFLIPKESGDYLFYIAADDQGEFWLSSDDNPQKAKLCVKVDAAVGRMQWDKEKRKSKPVSLVKGQRYFVKGLLRESDRNDHFSVAWSLAADDVPKLITAEYLAAESDSGAAEPKAAGSDYAKAEEDLRRVRQLVEEVAQLGEAAAAKEAAKVAPSNALADELDAQIKRAKEALGEAGQALQRVDAALSQHK